MFVVVQAFVAAKIFVAVQLFAAVQVFVAVRVFVGVQVTAVVVQAFAEDFPVQDFVVVCLGMVFVVYL